MSFGGYSQGRPTARWVLLYSERCPIEIAPRSLRDREAGCPKAGVIPGNAKLVPSNAEGSPDERFENLSVALLTGFHRQGSAGPAADSRGHYVDVPVSHVLRAPGRVRRLSTHEIRALEHQRGISVCWEIAVVVAHRIERPCTRHTRREPALPRVHIEDAHGLLLHQLLQLAGRDGVEAHQSGEHGCSLISALQSALGFARRSQTASPSVTRMAVGSKRKDIASARLIGSVSHAIATARPASAQIQPARR
jgi:hypothetical protein